MSLFQKSVLKKHLNDLNKEAVATAYLKFKANFANADKQANIREAKEEQYQEGFLRDLFVDVLGYTLNPQPGFNLTTEYKNEKDSKKADGAVLQGDTALAVIELKGTDTVDLDSVEPQAFGYKNNQKGCRYIIISNFEKLRFYIEDSVEHIEFDLFALDEEQFRLLYLCLYKENLLGNLPFSIKEASVTEERDVTKKLYNDYSNFKRKLYQNICALNPQYDKPLVYRKTQKLLDRFLFILFAEDKQLLPPNSIRQILEQWKQLQELDEPVPLYDRYKKYFGYMNTGHKGKQHDIFAYNGGLFAPDEVLDNIQVDDALLYDSTFALSQYDFETEVDVNILGHIFEHSLNDVDAVTAEAEGKQLEKDKTRRKKDGVFYTPKYITKYIVENTVGKLCAEKKAELDIKDEDYAGGKKKKDQRALNTKLEQYRHWLLQLTILDPACGSGAFLNQALDFLIAEHYKIDELFAKLTGASMVLSEYENHVLENNLYGVDLNEESIEIAKLSLWLRTAKKGRKLSALNNNIKCGNSLIDDPAVAGEKAFNWQQQFAGVFAKGGFDVVIGNPPYATKSFNEAEKIFYGKKYSVAQYQIDLYILFIELVHNVTKNSGVVGLITPNSWLKNLMMSGVRLFVLQNLQLDIIIPNLPKVFTDAQVDSLIVIGQKEKVTRLTSIREDSKIGFIEKHTINQNDYLKNEKYVFTVEANTDFSNILNKMKSGSKPLHDFFEITRGINPYDSYRGQSKEIIENKAYHSDHRKDDTFVPEIRGKHAKRYYYKWDGLHFISYGPWLAAPRDEKFFKGERIVFREILGKNFECTYIEEDIKIDRSLYIALAKNKETLSSKYALSLLASKLLAFYFRYSSNEFDELFPKIRLEEFKQLPIKLIEIEQQQQFIDRADKMIALNKDIQTIQSQFLQLLQSKVAIDKPSNKLQEWYILDFKGFLAELKKAKVKLSLAEEAEWMEYFNQQRSKAQALKAEIDKTDKEIDQLVYKLYNLTEEEIKIVEGA